MKGKHCKDCAFKGKFQNGKDACGITKLEIDSEKDFCSKFKDNPITCDNCKCIIPDSKFSFVAELEEDNWLTLCSNCVQMWLNS